MKGKVSAFTIQIQKKQMTFLFIQFTGEAEVMLIVLLFYVNPWLTALFSVARSCYRAAAKKTHLVCQA